MLTSATNTIINTHEGKPRAAHVAAPIPPTKKLRCGICPSCEKAMLGAWLRPLVGHHWQRARVDAALKPGRNFYDRRAEVHEMAFAEILHLVDLRRLEEPPLVRDLDPSGHVVL